MDISTEELIELRQELAKVKSEKQQLETKLLQINQKLNQVEAELHNYQDQNQKTLAQREAQFRLIAESAPISITISRVSDGNILYANQNACLILGVDYEQLIKRSSKEFYYDDHDRIRLIETFEKYGFIKDYEMPIKRADQTIVWVTVSLQSFIFNNEETILSVLYEITQRKEAEKLLKEKEVLLQLVLDNIPQLIFWKDRNSVFLGCNQQWAEKAGFTSPQEVIGQTDYDVNKDQEMAAKYVQQDLKIVKTGQPKLHFIEHKKNAEGQEIWFDTNKIPIRDLQGNVVGILGTIEDITEQKLVERELRYAKDQLRAVLDAVPGLVSWIDAEGKYLGVNQDLANKFGFKAEYFIGRKIGFLENSEQFTEFINHFFASSDPKHSQVVEMQIKGTQTYYLIAAQKYNEGQAMVLIGIDITQRKQAEESLRIAEENYRSIFENALEGIFQSTPDGKYIRVNPAMAKIHGYDDPDEMIANIEQIIAQIYVDSVKSQEFQYLMQTEGKVSNFEYQAYCKDGSIIWVAENTRSVRDSRGNLLYYEGIIEDITERKQQEYLLKRQLAELRIEIDHQKRIKEVAEITQSEYFQELQVELANLPSIDDFWE